jgi:selenocysteine lyase/cysteine desulfurase
MTRAYHMAHEKIKKHVNAGENDVIITTGSGMTGVVNKLQRIMGLRLSEKLRPYASIPEELRPVVFVTHMEHHSNQTSWIETICDVEVIPPDASGLVDMNNLEDLLKRYRDRRYKIGAFTACSNVTGIQTPYHSMAKLMHKYYGICFVDFAASGPYVKIDMHPADPEERLDGVYFSPHKFLGGPMTPGVVVFDRALYSNNIPDNPGGGTVDWTNPWGGHRYISDIELREDGGTPGFLQAVKASLCMELKERMTVDKMLKREKELMNILFSEMDNVDNLHMLAGNIRERMGIISFYVDNIHYNLLIKILNDRYGIQSRGGCSCAGTYGHYLLNIDQDKSRQITSMIDSGNLSVKPGWVRVSVHPTMTDEDIYYIGNAVRETVKNIKRWQEDYAYDPRSNEFRNVRCKGEKSIEGWFKL